MNQSLICSWLGLSNQSWPPDHYALLGLATGELDVARIEHCVQERMVRLRGYQIAHPEEATEGMNRLAQAFIVLSEQASKNSSSTKNLLAVVAKDDTQVGKQTAVDSRSAPPPVRQTPAASENGALKVEAAPAPLEAVKTPAIALTPPKPYDFLEALAQQSAEACRGIGTLPLLIERIEHTRRLLDAWQRAGKYLNQPARKLCSAMEEKELTTRLAAVFRLLLDYPRFFGQPGKPGYRVAAMARLEMTGLMFKAMGPDQRADLARDWSAGRKLLHLHRKFLRQQFKSLRKQSVTRRVIRGMRAALNDHPGKVLLAIVGALLLAGLIYRMFLI